MLLEQIYYGVEIIGVTAVIASLIFVGVQVRQNTDATRASNAQAVVTGWNEYSLLLATNENLLSIEQKGLRPELAELFSLRDERTPFRYYMAGSMKMFESNYLQWRNGNLDDDLWHGFRATYVSMFGINVLWTEYWDILQNTHSMPFRKLMAEILEEAEAYRTDLMLELTTKPSL